MSDFDLQATICIENLELAVSKLKRYTKDVSDAEMEWSPSGIKNSLSWIIRHCTGLLWVSGAYVSGQPIPGYVQDAGIAPGSLKGLEFSNATAAQSEWTRDLLRSELEAAWHSLKGLLDGSEQDWEERKVVFERRERNIWAPLWHFMADIAYHTGQASSLKKLLGAQRRRKQRHRSA